MPGHHKRGNFSNGPGRAGNKGPTANKGSRKILRARPGRLNRDEVFKSADKRLLMNLIQSTINVNVPMKYIFQFPLEDYKKNY